MLCRRICGVPPAVLDRYLPATPAWPSAGGQFWMIVCARLDAGFLVGITAQLRIALHLRSCEEPGGQQVVLQVSVAQLGLRGADQNVAA
jgi:hypothetical protein